MYIPLGNGRLSWLCIRHHKLCIVLLEVLKLEMRILLGLLVLRHYWLGFKPQGRVCDKLQAAGRAGQATLGMCFVQQVELEIPSSLPKDKSLQCPATNVRVIYLVRARIPWSPSKFHRFLYYTRSECIVKSKHASNLKFSLIKRSC